METENWITDVFKSTYGMTKVVPSEALFFKIQAKINTRKAISSQWIWLAAASFAILITLNIKLIYSKSNKSDVATEQIASTISKTNQLY
jgi:hypothetical protein